MPYLTCERDLITSSCSWRLLDESSASKSPHIYTGRYRQIHMISACNTMCLTMISHFHQRTAHVTSITFLPADVRGKEDTEDRDRGGFTIVLLIHQLIQNLLLGKKIPPAAPDQYLKHHVCHSLLTRCLVSRSHVIPRVCCSLCFIIIGSSSYQVSCGMVSHQRMSSESEHEWHKLCLTLLIHFNGVMWSASIF